MFDESILASRTTHMGSSVIREILKVVAQPGVVSLAGGLPAPEAFPMDIIRDLTNRVLDTYGVSALQYDRTEGFDPLREALGDYLPGIGVIATPGTVNVASGSQGVLDMLGKILITPGDVIAMEAPTYLGAIQAFNPYEPTYVKMRTDQHGLIPESMEEVVKKHRPKMVYLVPTFQNPTGRTIPLERRKEIARIAREYNVLVIEDDPYGALRYRGEVVPPIQSLAPDNVVYCGTFSKTFCPGIRTGYYVAPEFIRGWLVKAKQGIDLHTSTLSQALAAEYLRGGFLQSHLRDIIDLYKPKQEAMLDALDEHFPKEFSWIRPEGGMFIWLEGPKGLDVMPIYDEGIRRKVAFVPGRFFFTEPGDGMETMRLNFTMADEPTLRAAIERLAGVVKDALK